MAKRTSVVKAGHGGKLQKLKDKANENVGNSVDMTNTRSRKCFIGEE